MQLPFIGLLALGIGQLTHGLQGRAAQVSRVSAGVFAIFYVAMIAVLGVTLSLLVRYATGLTPHPPIRTGRHGAVPVRHGVADVARACARPSRPRWTARDLGKKSAGGQEQNPPAQVSAVAMSRDRRMPSTLY